VRAVGDAVDQDDRQFRVAAGRAVEPVEVNRDTQKCAFLLGDPGAQQQMARDPVHHRDQGGGERVKERSKLMFHNM